MDNYNMYIYNSEVDVNFQNNVYKTYFLLINIYIYIYIYIYILLIS